MPALSLWRTLTPLLACSVMLLAHTSFAIAAELPQYTRPPVVISLDYSPDGQFLAVTGFREVFVCKADGSAVPHRLVGNSERIETVRFSPDGARLAVIGGNPARNGEVQVWDWANQKQILSVSFTGDTLYGGSWSPDGKLLAFGAADNGVRAIDSTTGEQVLFQGAHSDWVRDTVFSTDGSHLVSVGRDMTTKLTEVGTQRFVDNVSSITPGGLKGGLQTVARHPSRDEIVIAGSDGVVRVYRMFRLTARVIGDDANLVRIMPPMRGRVFSAAVSKDGRRIAAGSSLDGSGEVAVYSYEFDTTLPENIKAINQKVADSRSAEERALLDQYHHEGVQQLAKIDLLSTSVYAVAFSPDGQSLAVGGADGIIRLFDPETGAPKGEFGFAPITPANTTQTAAATRPVKLTSGEREVLPEGATITGLTVSPMSITLESPMDTAQFVVTATLADGTSIDATRAVTWKLSEPVIHLSADGQVEYATPGRGQIDFSLADKSASVSVSTLAHNSPPDFVRDVNPVLSKLGCNQGTCHGAVAGKNGFKLSLRGYDPLYDIRALTDDLASRRANLASAADSLMLLKPTGAVPHAGGELLEAGDPYYQTIHDWIANGARVDLQTPKVVKIEIEPKDPIVQKIGSRQQMRVVATYADGRSRDVTREAFIDSGNTEVAVVGKGGRMGTVRRGEAPIMARFEGSYAATTLTVMGDRTGFDWQEPPAYNQIDQLVARKWERMKILPSPLTTDAEFLRRVWLDLTGLPPTAAEVKAFLADSRDQKTKREAMIDRLIGSDDFVEYWTNKWADLLQVNRKFLAPEGAAAFRQWIRQHVASNTPYDQFAREILTATGSNKDNPAASYFKVLRTPTETMENTTHLFLAVRFNCNKCHDHPFERWTQDQYYQTAAFFAQVGLERDPESGDRYIGGSAVEGAKPLYEKVVDLTAGDVLHDRTKKVTPPLVPFAATSLPPVNGSRRAHLAAWMTAPDNQFFAKSYVNRLWGYMFGVGIIEPIDDIRAGNPASNPELLNFLTDEFVKSNFNVRHILRLICSSRTYQLSVATNNWNADDKINYSHATARRLPAEVLYDAVMRATGSGGAIPGVAPGTRAAALPDSGIDLPSGFFTTFGRPVRESSCECERSSGLQLGPVMALISGPTIADSIVDPAGALGPLVTDQGDDREAIQEIFMRVLNRPATQPEIDAALGSMMRVPGDHAQLAKQLAELEAKLAPVRQEQEAARLAKVQQTAAELARYEIEIAPVVAQREAERVANVARLEAEQETRHQEIAATFETWSAAQQFPEWTLLKPQTLDTSNMAKLEQESDGAIFAENKRGPVTYTLVTQEPISKLTGLRLEVLTDDRLPNKGPGLSPSNGNFVLNEFAVELLNPANGEVTKIPLTASFADFAQSSFNIQAATDGVVNGDGNGWAIYGGHGKPHWAVFECASVDIPAGTQLVIRLHQNYSDATHSIGKFRVSLTGDAGPRSLGLPGEVETLVKLTKVGTLADPEAQKLTTFITERDDKWKQLTAELASARQPLPTDPGIVERKAAFESAKKPVEDDPVLVQLRKDFAMSATQASNPRLTMVQDLTWALINSPEFLFNH
jgi:WD40 repeat protein